TQYASTWTWSKNWLTRRGPSWPRSRCSHAQIAGRQPPRRGSCLGKDRIPDRTPRQACPHDGWDAGGEHSAAQPGERDHDGQHRARRWPDERRVPQAPLKEVVTERLDVVAMSLADVSPDVQSLSRLSRRSSKCSRTG